jgi:membrane-bound lytic murein transglycosylase D
VERRHRIAPGESLSSVAAKYGITTAALAELNGMSPTAKLRAGGMLVVPSAQAPTLAAAATSSPAARPAVEPEQPEGNVYIVRSGDSIYEIARKTGMKESEILRLNRLRNPNYIFEGQKLILAAAPSEPAQEASQPETPAAAASRPARRRSTRPVTQPKPIVVASAEVAEGVAPAEAQRESEEDAEAVEKVGESAEQAQPVSAAQAEALGPALGPAIEVPQTADPIDYSVAQDGTIVVVAEETLGHYAEWLGIRASRLRQVNNMKYGRPVLIGHKLKLDFSKVTPEQFEQTRREYHRALQASYFAAHRILGTEIYIVRRGDSLWTVTQRFARLPMWLLQQYNPDVDFSEMRAGTELLVPKVEELATDG